MTLGWRSAFRYFKATRVEEVAERRVEALGIVESFDVIEEHGPAWARFFGMRFQTKSIACTKLWRRYSVMRLGLVARSAASMASGLRRNAFFLVRSERSTYGSFDVPATVLSALGFRTF